MLEFKHLCTDCDTKEYVVLLLLFVCLIKSNECVLVNIYSGHVVYPSQTHIPSHTHSFLYLDRPVDISH